MSDAPERPWWRTFFDAGYRQLWSPVTGDERTEDEVAGLVEMLDAWARARGRPLMVADVCGGDGRIARPLAARTEHAVVVIDGARSMLAHGRGRSDAAHVAGWIEADARAVPLARGCVDVVLCMFTSFGLGHDVADHMAMLGSMGRALRPGGRLVLEMTHRDFAAALAERRSWFELPDGTVVVRSFELDPWTGRTDEQLRVVRGGRDTVDDVDTVRRWSVRLFTPTELVRMLRAVGLQCVAVHGSLHGDPFETSEPRMILIAERLARGDDPSDHDETTMGREPMTMERLVERLRCPVTGQPLRWLDAERLAALTASDDTIEAALVREDGRVAYPVRQSIPVLMADEAIALDDDDPATTEHEPT